MIDFQKSRKDAVEKANRSMRGEDKESEKLADKNDRAGDRAFKLGDKVDAAVESGNPKKADRANDRLGKAGEKMMDTTSAVAADEAADAASAGGGNGASYEESGPAIDSDAPSRPAPGVYSAKGDDYGYELLEDGNVVVTLPGGRGTTTVKPGDSAHAAILGQIKSGQLAAGGDKLDTAASVMATPKVDEKVGSTTRPPPEQAGPTTELDTSKTPQLEMARLRDRALKKAYGENAGGASYEGE